MYGFLDPHHVFVLVHVVLDIGLASSRLSRAWAFGSEMPRVIAVIALLDPLGSRVALEGFFYLSNVSPEVLLVCPVRGEVSSGEVHWDGDVVHGSWGIRGIELRGCSAVAEPRQGAVIESLQGPEDRGIHACSHCSEELSGFDHCNGFVF